MKNNLLVSGGVALLVVVLGLVFFGQSSVIERITDRVGSVVSSDALDERVCQGGVCTWDKAGAFNDASTTLFAIQNPFRATSTWTMAVVDVTGESTTSVGINVGTSTNTGPVHISGTTAGGYRGPHLIEGVVVGTGLGYIRSGTVFATSSGLYFAADNQPSVGVGLNPGTTTRSVIIGPNEYVVGYATGSTNGVTNTNNAFTGNFSLKFERGVQ